jgi:hypothetical protein
VILAPDLSLRDLVKFLKDRKFPPLGHSCQDYGDLEVAAAEEVSPSLADNHALHVYHIILAFGVPAICPLHLTCWGRKTPSCRRT